MPGDRWQTSSRARVIDFDAVRGAAELLYARD